MKQLSILFCVFISFFGTSQTWNSYPTTIWGFNAVGPNVFKLDRYQNELWFARESHPRVTCLHLNTGERDTVSNLSLCGYTCTKDVAFTPTNQYIMMEYTGLHRINTDYSVINVYNEYDVSRVSQNEDTIYLINESLFHFLRYTSSGSVLTDVGFRKITAKGNWFYPSNTNSSLEKYTGVGASGYQNYAGLDPEHTCGVFHDIKFSPYSDSIYVSCSSGINIAYSYDFIYNINPSNTVNMPTANVLEFEFDTENNIWAVFGDTNDEPYALAQLVGNSWVNYYDGTNSPIDFTRYEGFEIDTNGVIWVLERTELHTLSFGNNPSWLNTVENAATDFTIYPNPANDQFTIESESSEPLEVTIFSATGQLIKTHTVQSGESISISDLNTGFYTVQIEQNGEKTTKTFVKL